MFCALRSDSFSRLVSAGFLFAALALQSAAQQSSSQSDAVQSKTVLKANTRLVVLDVVVTDRDGQPVSGLTAADFSILEDGKPQSISGFSFQHPETRLIQTTLHLPPNVVSNIQQRKASCLNVILLDTLNGDFAGHAQAQEALIKYLETAQLSQPVAIFALQEKLVLLHDFTTDSEALKSAVEKFRPPARTNQAESIQSRASAFTTKGDFHTGDSNIEATLSQLHALARTLAQYPGRKNVIWLSESFPLVLAPETAVQDSISVAHLAVEGEGRGARTVVVPTTFDAVRNTLGSHDRSALVQKVAQAMMNAQVAIYPVDSTALGKDDHLASQHTMNELAEDTGGKAFYNRNDLIVGLRTSLEDGATYYTLTYYPDNKKWDGRFRIISVKSARAGVTLRHRLGYYAIDPEITAKEEPKMLAEDFSRALTLDAPTVSSVVFQAGVVPPDNNGGKVVVNFAIDPQTLAFEKRDDGSEHASVSCVVWAFSGKGDPQRAEGTSNADLKPDVYAQVMKSYLPCQRTLNLKSGKYTLKLGVLDRMTNHIGTTVTTVVVP